MSYIEELRQRVETAERRFGLIDEQQRRYSERLITLMNALESAQEERQAEATSHQARIVELERENGELRGMLHALLLGVEAGGRDTLADTLRDLDARLSGMVPSAPSEMSADEIAGDDDVASVAEDGLAVALPEDEPQVEGGLDVDDISALETDEVIAAAEQAVAELLNADAGAVEDFAMEDMAGVEIAVDEMALDEMAMEVAAEGDPASSVAEMIGRLADETQDFAEPELAFGERAEEAAAEPLPAPKPARKEA